MIAGAEITWRERFMLVKGHAHGYSWQKRMDSFTYCFIQRTRVGDMGLVLTLSGGDEVVVRFNHDFPKRDDGSEDWHHPDAVAAERKAQQRAQEAHALLLERMESPPP